MHPGLLKDLVNLNLFQPKEEELDREIKAAEMHALLKRCEALAATIRAERQSKEVHELFLKVEALAKEREDGKKKWN